MKELKIKPIELKKATTAKGIGKNISDVLDFQVSTADETNRVIASLNKLLPKITTPFDDSELKADIAKVKKLAAAQYDDSELVKKLTRLTKDVDSLMLTEQVEYDDSVINDKIEALEKENESLRKSLKVNQAEFRSLRNMTGSQIDELRKKLDALTEIK